MSYGNNTLPHAFASKTWNQKVVESVVRRSWWVLLFILFCFVVYSQAMSKKQVACLELQNHLEDLKQQKELISRENSDLTLQINSQSDPAWIQLTLMKGLGVVPEGQMKVYFHNRSE